LQNKNVHSISSQVVFSYVAKFTLKAINNMLLEITSCEICDNTNLSSVLDLGLHPMCDDLVRVGDERICKEYPIEILFCEKCITAHQRFQIPKEELFPKTYHYRSRHTGDVLKGMRELVESCEKTCGSLAGKKVLDIGCNDGSLLSIFREKGAKTYGIEPTSAFNDAIKNHHEVINDFLCESIATDFVKKYGHPDIITFTNVFAHIEDLKSVVRSLKILMHEKTIIIIENHYLGAVIDKFQFDTFYHEHPRNYSCKSFFYIAGLLGAQLSQVEFPSRYNGNIRVTYTPQNNQEGTMTAPINLDEIFEREKNFGKGLREMAKKINPWREKKRAEIESLVKEHGKLSGKAFPGRAAILVKMLGLDTDVIKAVYEKPQSGKLNHYIPGTRIQILSDDEFDAAENKAPLLNLAWHINDEIRSYMQSRGFEGQLIDIISKEDQS
jgi:2-polyprenyl-3-methyl-5-hydroxy-6-metoxy-1,4-benzoquinol methylase